MTTNIQMPLTLASYTPDDRLLRSMHLVQLDATDEDFHVHCRCGYCATAVDRENAGRLIREHRIESGSMEEYTAIRTPDKRLRALLEEMYGEYDGN